MAPSRGSGNLSAKPNSTDTDEIAVSQQSNSALANARRNFSYLINPGKASSATDRPGRLRTRALLRTVRYVSQFIFWRLVRWAKYAAVGFIVAAVSATAIGSVFTGAAWVIAPTSLGGSIIAASIWGVGKFTARRLHNRWKSTGGDQGEVSREYASDHPVAHDSVASLEVGPRAVPW